VLRFRQNRWTRPSAFQNGRPHGPVQQDPDGSDCGPHIGHPIVIVYVIISIVYNIRFFTGVDDLVLPIRRDWVKYCVKQGIKFHCCNIAISTGRIEIIELRSLNKTCMSGIRTQSLRTDVLHQNSWEGREGGVYYLQARAKTSSGSEQVLSKKLA
jgi:hypothetical protein